MRESLIKFIGDSYGAAGEPVVRSDPDSLVFKAPNGRWFGFIRTRNGRSGTVDVIDLQGCKNAIELFRGIEGVHASNRMMKDDWISIDLDGSVGFNMVCEAVDIAYGAIGQKTSYSTTAGDTKARLSYLAKRIREQNSFKGRVYGDSSLDGSVPAEPEDVPERIREMRNLFTRDDYHMLSEPVIFYRMARFMEDYEDDCPFEGSFSQPFQTYRMMGNAQIRGYFTWRTGVRKGVLEETYPSYAYTYVCELINGIGWKDPEEGFGMLKGFLDDYAKIDVALFPYDYIWLSDFAACYNIESPDINRTGSEEAYLCLSDLKNCPPEKLMSLAPLISSYRIESMKVNALYPEDTQEVFVRALRNADAAFREDGGKGLCDMMFRKNVNSYYRMFPTAVFYDAGKRDDYVYSVPGVADYRCSGSVWIKVTHSKHPSCNKFLGEVARCTDLHLRERLGIKPALKPRENDAVEDFVRTAADEWFEEKRIRSIPKVEVDTSRLVDIRRDAETTMEKIMTSEERAQEPVPEEELREVPADTPLTPDEYEFVRRLLYGGAWDEVLKSKRMMLSVVVDSINGKLFDEFGDSVLTEESGRPEIVGDYVEELKVIVRP
ncbi:hypothetical protein TALC_01372 [Thermoplasmatales archaeon BRNA1]|nr:hypothetical protein TALC_01372 [Thermoplasmatales archaeon BRNA1]